MPKRRKRRRQTSRSTSEVASSLGRNPYLDALRGLAILLMIVDHVAAIPLQIPISGSATRLVTRLSMPLFCLLMGYFLKVDSRFDAFSLSNWRKNRMLQIAGAAILANLVFWPHYQCLEILGSLLLAYGLFLAMGRFFPVLVLSLLLYQHDVLRPWFDYPPSIVISFVAHGMVLRRFGFLAALASGIFLFTGGWWIEPDSASRWAYWGGNQKLCLFVLPATLLVEWGRQMGEREQRQRPSTSGKLLRGMGLEKIGQHPLLVYLAQYYIVFAIDVLRKRLS